MQNEHRQAYEWGRVAGHLAPFIAGLAVAGAAVLIRRWRENVGANWPTVQGQVQFVDVRDREGRDRLKQAVITYSYFLGEYQSGEYIRVFLRERRAWDFANGLKDKGVTVHYKPNKPSVSTLRRDELDRLLPVEHENSFAGRP